MTATFGVTLPEARTRRVVGRLRRFQSSDETEGRSGLMEREENKSSHPKTRMHSLVDVRVIVLIFECVCVCVRLKMKICMDGRVERCWKKFSTRARTQKRSVISCYYKAPSCHAHADASVHARVMFDC